MTDMQRTYTGEFPPSRPDMTVDQLVAELVESVERVRIKYGIAVEDLATRQGADVEDVLTWIDSRFDIEADERRTAQQAKETVR